MSFFIKDKRLNGAKRAKYSNNKTNKKPKTNLRSKKDEEITSSEDEGPLDHSVPEASSSEDENETAQDKKLRLAKIYLEEIEKEERARLEDKEFDQNIISKRIKNDYLKETGKLRLTVAGKIQGVVTENIKTLKCRECQRTTTCLYVTSDNKFVFAGGKDGIVVKYCLEKYKKVGFIPFVKKQSNGILGHSSQISSMAVSTDTTFLAVADDSSNIYIWDPNTLKHIKTLTGHKKTVTGLCFRKDSHTLYSCSKDRTVKVWSLDEMAYVETLFGHQDGIASIDTLFGNKVVSCGGKDLRIWKIAEEAQLIFNGHSLNIDCVRLLNEENFISGGDDGQLCVWSVLRKKPLCVVQNAHGLDGSNQQPFWIVALTSLPNTDLVATGSLEGFVKLWKLDSNFKACSCLLSIPVDGFVNSLSFTSDGSKLIVAVSKEHKLGRWTTIKSAKNCILVIPFVIK